MHFETLIKDCILSLFFLKAPPSYTPRHRPCVIWQMPLKIFASALKDFDNVWVIIYIYRRSVRFLVPWSPCCIDFFLLYVTKKNGFWRHIYNKLLTNYTKKNLDNDLLCVYIFQSHCTPIGFCTSERLVESLALWTFHLRSLSAPIKWTLLGSGRMNSERSLDT